MRIAFDLDGVLVDLHRTFADAALRLFPDLDEAAIQPADVGASPPGAADATAEENRTGEPDSIAGMDPVARNLPLTRQQVSAIWRELCAIPDFWETLAETEAGSVVRLAAVAEERRWEVIFLTSRPTSAGRTVQRQSQRWLARCGFPLPSVYVVQGSRGRIAEALDLDIVVDDRPDNCLDVVLESKARAILVWRGVKATVPASAKRLGIGVVPTVQACLDILLEADRPADTPADLMQRLRRLLGLQTKSALPSNR